LTKGHYSKLPLLLSSRLLCFSLVSEVRDCLFLGQRRHSIRALLGDKITASLFWLDSAILAIIIT